MISRRGSPSDQISTINTPIIEEEAQEANPSSRIYIAKVLAERVYETLGIYRQLVVTQKVAPQMQFSLSFLGI